MNITTLRLFSVLITILIQSFVYVHGGVAIYSIPQCVPSPRRLGVVETGEEGGFDRPNGSASRSQGLSDRHY